MATVACVLRRLLDMCPTLPNHLVPKWQIASGNSTVRRI